MAYREDLGTEGRSNDFRAQLGRQVRTAAGEDTQLGELALLRLPQVLALIPISRSAWWEGIRAGKYPAPRKLGPRTSAWRASDIRVLLESFAPKTPAEGARP